LCKELGKIDFEIGEKVLLKGENIGLVKKSENRVLRISGSGESICKINLRKICLISKLVRLDMFKGYCFIV
jgi:hypothetical protein